MSNHRIITNNCLITLCSAPLALYASAGYATVYFNVTQAQAAVAPGVLFSTQPKTLTDAERKAISKASGVAVRENVLKLWRGSDGSFFWVDQVLGKHEFITYALLLSADGAVKAIEVMEYKETYGDQIRNPKWRAQFTGKRTGAALKLDSDIKNISGATLSCKHISDGVKRILATQAVLAGDLATHG